MIRRVNGVDAVINTWDSYYRMSCRHICRETPGNLRYTSVLVTRSRQESRERETDFLKNCSDLINKKRNKRCLRQLTSAIVTFFLDFLLVYFSTVETRVESIQTSYSFSRKYLNACRNFCEYTDVPATRISRSRCFQPNLKWTCTYRGHKIYSLSVQRYISQRWQKYVNNELSVISRNLNIQW